MRDLLQVAIYEDNAMLRKQLSQYLNAQEDVEVIGSFSNAINISKDLKEIHPDVVIMDIDMPGIDGVRAVKLCKECQPDIQIIMYTVFEDDDKLFDSLCAGADGYILKKSPPQMLTDAIHDVYAGGVPLSPNIARKVLSTFQKQQKEADQFKLTKRELEILHLLTKGYSYKQIANECFIALDTVRKHVQHIYTKLHVRCGTEAVAKALKYRLV